MRHSSMRDELLRRAQADQEVRRAGIEWMNKFGRDAAGRNDLGKESLAAQKQVMARIKAVDEKNTTWLKATVREHGWPTISMIGRDAAHSAWLLVQHADADPGFQRRCLDLMMRLPNEEVLRNKFPYLIDRVLLAEGRKQRYGTQFTNRDGKWVPRPLENEAGVDRRRAEFGLPPLAEYVEQLESMYGKAAPK
ncbi:MAG: hypothetical protein DWQ37_05325 [Planctomycetota bacterium]|nr:MAG: hypothetical protein DWQ37_05325 [Planctomycetota bacterium]